MSKEKQTPCEAAWEEWSALRPSMAEREHEYCFSAGFRAGEEGKAELLEACELLVEWDGAGDAPEMLQNAVERARAALSKHTAK